ncbi:hypothetical protein Tco_1385292 [Tanacetum coccineum]
MPTKMELTLEQTQQGVSSEVSNSILQLEILSRRFFLNDYLVTGRLTDSDRKLKDGGEVSKYSSQKNCKSFRHSDTERLS